MSGVEQSSEPLSEDVFDHPRSDDGEHVGYIGVTAHGDFLPYDLLWQRRGEPGDLDDAEAVLDAIGLRMLADDWLLEEDGDWSRVKIREISRHRVVVGRVLESMSGHVAKAVDLVGGIEVALPTERLRPAP